MISLHQLLSWDIFHIFLLFSVFYF